MPAARSTPGRPGSTGSRSPSPLTRRSPTSSRRSSSRWPRGRSRSSPASRSSSGSATSTSPSRSCFRRAGSPSSCTPSHASARTCWSSSWRSGGTRRSARAPGQARPQRSGGAHGERRRLAAVLRRQGAAGADAQAGEGALADGVQAAEQEAGLAQDALAAARRANAAGHLAEGLHVGDDCPVCLQTVTALPHHPAAADLSQARAASEAAAQEHKRLMRAHGDAATATAGARSTAEATRRRLAEVESFLGGSPSEAEVALQLKLIAAADQALDAARREVAARRGAGSAAERERTPPGSQEKKASAAPRQVRDPAVGLGAPEVDA